MKTSVLSRLALTAGGMTLGALIALPAMAQTAATPEIPAWLNKISLGGDFTVRLQHTNAKTSIDDTESIRARIGITGKATDQITVNVRLASGTSTNLLTSSLQTEGDGWAKKGFYLDIASMDYKPMDGLVITAGKALNPFYKAGGNEVIFDNDVNPEGFNAKYSMELGAFKPFVTLSHNMITDTGAGKTPADVTLFGAQVGSSFKAESFSATLAVASYNYNNVKGNAPIYFAASKGNTLDTGKYKYEYRLTDVEAEVSAELFSLPFTVYGGYVTNADPSEKNKGSVGGLRVGKLADAGSWMVNYSYRDLEADATIGAFVDGDQNNTTDIRGHKVSIGYMPVKGFTAGINGMFMNQTASTTGSDNWWERYTLDLTATF